MRLQTSAGDVQHLSYCSNIHPGESWSEVSENLAQHLPGIRAQLSPDEPFGIGLRLSASSAETLSRDDNLSAFKQFLSDGNYYVFTINGFPYGPFHGTRVKEDVYLPDWMDPERVRYSNQLADVFAKLMPQGEIGSISTVPGAFKANVKNTANLHTMADNLVMHASHLAWLERDTGACITTALEPEPCCYLETIDESIEFFQTQLFSQRAITKMAALAGTDNGNAEALLRKHLTLCLDICHAAVEFEDAAQCLDKLRSAGIGIGKLQISAGLRLENVTPDSAEILRPFDDGVYLHQVVENHNGTINRYTDLPLAFANLSDDKLPREWRVHFHVPIFHNDLGNFSSTQFFIREMLALHRQQPISNHLEVETYTWNVLPPAYRNTSIGDAIVNELSWVKNELGQ